MHPLLLFLRRRQQNWQLMLQNVNVKKRSYVRPAHLENGHTRFRIFESYYNSAESSDLVRFCRLTRNQFDELLDLIMGDITHESTHESTHRYPICPRWRLAICLRYLASGVSFDQLAHKFGTGKSTAHVIVFEVCKAVIKRLTPLVLPPPSPDQWLQRAAEFEERWNFPHAVLAMDGKHVRICKLADSGSVYFNYKHFHSIVLLALVDANYRFVMAEVGGPGRMSDLSLFASSEIRAMLENPNTRWPGPTQIPAFGWNLPYIILADKGFGISDIVLTPFTAPSTDTHDKLVFNQRLSSARQVVEDTFGQLVTRWRLLARAIDATPDRCSALTFACVLLHNLLRNEEIHADAGPVAVDPEVELLDALEAGVPRIIAARMRCRIYRDRFVELMRRF